MHSRWPSECSDYLEALWKKIFILQLVSSSTRDSAIYFLSRPAACIFSRDTNDVARAVILVSLFWPPNFGMLYMYIGCVVHVSLRAKHCCLKTIYNIVIYLISDLLLVFTVSIENIKRTFCHRLAAVCLYHSQRLFLHSFAVPRIWKPLDYLFPSHKKNVLAQWR